MQALNTLVTNIQNVIVGLAATVFVICVVVAGLMRMLSFGNERRVAISNMALTAAVVGLVIILISVALRGFLVGLFPTNPGVGK
jgi:Type IV secretion system pilin